MCTHTHDRVTWAYQTSQKLNQRVESVNGNVNTNQRHPPADARRLVVKDNVVSLDKLARKSYLETGLLGVHAKIYYKEVKIVQNTSGQKKYTYTYIQYTYTYICIYLCILIELPCEIYRNRIQR